MSEIMKKSCADFTEVLGAKEPVPGGGAATALVGACAAALLAMVGNYTTGKKKYADVEKDVRRMLVRAEELRVHLLALAEKDAENFEPLSLAYAIPKDTPGREDALEVATEKACEAPLEMMEGLCKGIDLLAEMEQKGNRMLLSDVGCGALFAGAALEAAAMNVFVNTGGLRNRARAKEINDQARDMLARGTAAARETAARVRASLEQA